MAGLFFRECRQIWKSLLYWLFLIVFVIDICVQMDFMKEMDELLREPKENQESYGWKITDNMELIMGNTLARLLSELEQGYFVTYPTGFYKKITPGESEKKEMTEILERASGKSIEELSKEEEAYYQKFDQESYQSISTKFFLVAPAPDYHEKTFQKDMERVCELVGKGSGYEEAAYREDTKEPMTYEDAMKAYRESKEQDLFTRGLMRLYCDYAGIVLAVLVVFLGVAASIRDKRNKACEVIYAKSVSSVKLMGCRYLANLFMVWFPVVLLAAAIEIPYLYTAHNMGLSVDVWAFLVIPTWWLLPEIAVVLGLSFFLTEALGPIVAIILQVFWGLASLMTASSLVGDFGLHLIARWNSTGGAGEFLSQQQTLFENRLYYLALGVLFYGLSCLIYHWKRTHGGTMLWQLQKN